MKSFVLFIILTLYSVKQRVCVSLFFFNQYNSLGRTQGKTDIAFLAFFETLDKEEDNSSLGYHCGVKF